MDIIATAIFVKIPATFTALFTNSSEESSATVPRDSSAILKPGSKS